MDANFIFKCLFELNYWNSWTLLPSLTDFSWHQSLRLKSCTTPVIRRENSLRDKFQSSSPSKAGDEPS